MSAGTSGSKDLFMRMVREAGLESLWLARSSSIEMLLDVCSLPRVFDRALVEDVLLPLTMDWRRQSNQPGTAAEVPTSEELLLHPDVEGVPGSDDLFRLRSAPRGARLAEWVRALERGGARQGDDASNPAREGRGAFLVRASREIAAACAERGADWELERLYQLIAADPHQAAQAISREYARCDVGFDRVRCYELICLLEARDALLTEELVRTRDQLRRYFDSRILWSDAYTQSAHALERDFMHEAFEWVRTPSREWIGVLEAKGGMGKSMFVRWLIARRCVPEPIRIPCARIDFDFPLPTLLAEYPWMIIPRLVEQLDVQLPWAGERSGTSELQRLAGQIEEQYRIASQSQSVAHGAGRALSQERSRTFGAEAAERFGRALAERATGPVLIVFDTVEEAYLRRELFSSQGQNVLDAVMTLLHAVHTAHPPLKVVFAGRFSPAGPDATRDFASRHEGQLRPIRLMPFSNAEATAYLANVRGLARAGSAGHDARIAAIVSRSDGLPLVLALWADIVLARNSITVKEITESPEADLAYLVERVLDRLRDGRLHWVIRYGVIPRRLTREFFGEVLLPRMREAMQGRAPHDDPATDSIPGNVERQRFRTNLIGANEDIDADALWQELSLYVSGSSFVSRSAEDAAAIAFHTEVVGPMRRVLQQDQHETYRALHADAVAFFETQGRSATSEADRATALREAIYHLLQDDSDAVAATFERWVHDASRSGDSLFGKVLVDELFSLQQASGGTFTNPLAPVLLLTAHTMRLEALMLEVQRAAPAERAAAWVSLAKSADEFRRFRSEYPQVAGPEYLLRLAEANIALNFQGAQAALPKFEDAIMAADSSPRRLSATLGGMDAADRLGLSDRAQAHGDAAWTLLQNDAFDIPVHARLEFARLYDALRNTAYVIALLEPMAREGVSAPVAHVAGLIRAYLNAGRVADAATCALRLRERIATDPQTGCGPDEQAYVDGLCALALLRHGDASSATTLIDGPLHSARMMPRRKQSSGVDASLAHRTSAIASASVAVCRVEQLEPGAALEAAEMAQQEWAVTGDAEEAGAALAQRAQLALFELGDYRLAGSLLDESQRLTLPPASEVRGRLLLLRALRRHFAEDGMGGVRELRTLLDDVSVRRWRALRLLVLGALLHLDADGIMERLNAFEHDLLAVHPEGARLEIIGMLARWMDAPLDLPSSTNAQLARLAVAVGVRTTADSDVRAEGSRSRWLQALCAHFFNQSDIAHIIVEQLLQECEPDAQGVRGVELSARLAQSMPLKHWGPMASRFRHDESLSAHARGRLHLALAEIALAHESTGLASTMVSKAITALNADGLSSQWEVHAHLLAAAIASLSPVAEGARVRTPEAQQRVKPQLDRARQLAHALGGSERMRERLLGRRLRVSHRSATATVRVTGDAVYATGNTPSSSLSIDGAPPAASAAELSGEFVLPTRETILWTSWNEGLMVGAMDAATSIATSEFDPLAVLAPTTDGEVISFALVKRATDEWTQFSADLSRATMAQDVIRHTAGRWKGGAIRLVLDPLSIAALPFEQLSAEQGDHLALQSASGNRGVYRGTSRGTLTPVRWVQEALAETGRVMIVDGVWGPKSTAALREFQQEVQLSPTGTIDAPSIIRLAERMTEGRPSTPVAMIVGGLAGARRSVRSATFRVKNVFDASALYKSVGFDALAVSDQFSRELIDTRPSVIHLQGSFDEVSSLGGVVMTPRGAPSDLHADEALSPSTFGRTLRSIPQPYRPIVVLDPPRARSRTESVRQLLLRNVFAHELFRLDCAPAVFAAGFEDPDGGHTVRSYQVFADAWRNRRPVLDVLQRLRADRTRRARDERDLVSRLLESPSLLSIAYASTPALSFFVVPGRAGPDRATRGPA